MDKQIYTQEELIREFFQHIFDEQDYEAANSKLDILCRCFGEESVYKFDILNMMILCEKAVNGITTINKRIVDFCAKIVLSEKDPKAREHNSAAVSLLVNNFYVSDYKNNIHRIKDMINWTDEYIDYFFEESSYFHLFTKVLQVKLYFLKDFYFNKGENKNEDSEIISGMIFELAEEIADNIESAIAVADTIDQIQSSVLKSSADAYRRLSDELENLGENFMVFAAFAFAYYGLEDEAKAVAQSLIDSEDGLEFESEAIQKIINTDSADFHKLSAWAVENEFGIAFDVNVVLFEDE